MALYQHFRLAFFCLVLLAGCGYHNPYAPRTDSQPISIHRSIWKNNTNELGLEIELYNALSNWLRKSPFIQIHDQETEANYLLTGTIDSVEYLELSYGLHNEATELRIHLIVHYVLIEQETGAKIWDKKQLYTEPLKKDPNPSQLQANKKEALIEIADDIAEEIYLFLINRAVGKR